MHSDRGVCASVITLHGWPAAAFFVSFAPPEQQQTVLSDSTPTRLLNL